MPLFAADAITDYAVAFAFMPFSPLPFRFCRFSPHTLPLDIITPLLLFFIDTSLRRHYY